MIRDDDTRTAMDPTTDPLAPLLEDHVMARQALDALEQAARSLEVGAPVDREFWGYVLEFFDDYFDRVHHPKEEELLLPLLASEGYARSHMAAAQMRREHDSLLPCRLHLQHAVELGSVARLRASVRQFLSLHRRHMELEERHVFPLARDVLGAAAQHELRTGFAEMEADGERDHARRLLERIRATTPGS